MNSSHLPFRLQCHTRKTLISPFCVRFACAVLLSSSIVSGQRAPDLKTIAEELDQLSAFSERLGTISVSAPKLINPASGQRNPFAFVPGLTAADHFAAAKKEIQGGLRVSDQLQTVMKAGASVELDETASVLHTDKLEQARAQTSSYNRGVRYRKRAAEQKRDAALAAIPDTATPAERKTSVANAEHAYYTDLASLEATSPGGPVEEEPDTAGTPATGSLLKDPISNQLLAASELGLRSANAAPVISNRAALVHAAGDTATQGIFTVLADSNGYARLEGKRTLLGALMVNVEPGWGTREKFIAEASVSAKYRYDEAREAVVQRVYEHTNDPKMIAMIWRARPDLALHLETLSIASSQQPELLSQWQRRLLNAARALTKDAWSLPQADTNSAPPPHVGSPAQQFRWRAIHGELQVPDLAGEQVAPLNATIATPEAAPPSHGILGGSGIGQGRARPPRTDQDGERPIPEHLRLAPEYLPSPLAIAVSPMTDVQTMDFDSTMRRRYEYSLAIAGAFKNVGQKAQAEFFASFARQLQSDLALRTQQATITSFSLSGGVFGFRIAPQLDAQMYPGNKPLKSTGKHILKRTSFPAMVMVELEQEDLTLRFSRYRNTARALEPTLVFHQSTRWTPVSRPRDGASLFWNRPKRMQDEQMFRLVKRAIGHRADLERFLFSQPSFEQAEQAQYLHTKLERISMPHKGSYSEHRLPTDYFSPEKMEVPRVTRLRQSSVRAAELSSSAPFTIVVEGHHLDQLDRVEALNTTIVDVRWSPTGRETGEITLRAPGGWPSDGSMFFRLSTADGVHSLLTPPFEISATSAPSHPGPFRVIKTVTKDGDNSVEEYSVQPDRSAWLEALIRRDTPPSK